MEDRAQTRSPSMTWVTAGFLVAASVLQLIELRTRFIDPDEFEHLHAASMVARGQVPYRDFFEHHGPLLYYALQPLFWLFGQQLTVLWIGRGLMWLCSMGVLALTARQAARLGGSGCGPLAAALLAWTTVFHLKGIELRPDLPAMLLLQLAIMVVIEPGARFRAWFAAGVLGGLATLCTQKAIVPIAGLACAGIAREIVAGNGMKAVRTASGLAAGGAVAWGGAFAAFALAGAAGDLFHGTVVQLVAWPVRSQRWEHLRPTLAADLAVWIAGAVEIATTFRQPRDRTSWETGRGVYAIVCAFSILALGWVKATYPQFYLLWFPVLSALAARRLIVWCSAVPGRLVRAGILAVGVVLATGEGWLWARAWKLGLAGALPTLTTLLRDVAPIGGLIAPPLILALLVAAIWLFSRREWRAAVIALCAIGMFHGTLRNIDAALTSNREQVRRVEVVQRHVPPDGTVLDGFSGYAVLRPNAYYFWWINEYSLALMTPAQREADLLESLKESPPAAVLFDEHLALLPRPVTDWINEQYAPMIGEDWFWVSRDDSSGR